MSALDWVGPNRDRFEPTRAGLDAALTQLLELLHRAADDAIRVQGGVENELHRLHLIEQQVRGWLNGMVQAGEQLFDAGLRLLGIAVHHLPAPGSPQWDDVRARARAHGFPG
jgi:hypothetical protein